MPLPPPPPHAAAVTHSHGDHIGGLPLLLEAYPEAPVVLYELEAPYLVPGEDGKAQRLVAPGTLLDRALRWAGMLAQQPVTVSACSRWQSAPVFLLPGQWPGCEPPAHALLSMPA